MEWLSNPVKQSAQNMENQKTISPLATWLLIFDNADDLDVLRDYWPSTENGAIVITSRDPLAKMFSTVTDGIDLEPLIPEEGSDLMMNIAGYKPTTDNKEQSLELVKRLGGLPLAISQISAMIGRRDMTFKEFLDIYEEDASNRAVLLDQDQYQHTLSTYWGLEDLSSSARCLLDLLSLLDPDSILEDLLVDHFPLNPTNDFPSSKLLYIEARKHLIRSSLVRRNKDRGQLLVHRVIQDVTRARMSRGGLKAAFELAVSILSQNWPQASYSFSHETSLWAASDKVVPH